jgi:hypothetical protein
LPPLPVWTAAMAGPAASLPGVRFGRGLHRRCCPLLRLWGRLRWPGRRAPPALPGWGGRCPWCPPLAVRRRRGRCRGLHQRCHSCVPLALDLPPRWRFGPGALGSRTACGCRVAAAAGAAVGYRRCARTALRCPLPGRATPSGAGRGVLRGVECRRARRAGTESGQLRHRHPHTSPDGKRRRGCCERRCGKGGCLAGPASEAGWSCPALPELLAHRKRQRRQRVSTGFSCVFVCGEVSGDPLLLLLGSASVPCARVLAKSEEPPPHGKRPRAHDQWRGNPTAKAPAATPTASTAAFPASLRR